MPERTMDGLAAARARGRTGGQKPRLGPRQVKLAREMYDERGEDGKRKCTVQQIVGEFGVCRPTVYRVLERHHIRHAAADDENPSITSGLPNVGRYDELLPLRRVGAW